MRARNRGLSPCSKSRPCQGTSGARVSSSKWRSEPPPLHGQLNYFMCFAQLPFSIFVLNVLTKFNPPISSPSLFTLFHLLTSNSPQDFSAPPWTVLDGILPDTISHLAKSLKPYAKQAKRCTPMSAREARKIAQNLFILLINVFLSPSHPFFDRLQENIALRPKLCVLLNYVWLALL